MRPKSVRDILQAALVRNESGNGMEPAPAQSRWWTSLVAGFGGAIGSLGFIVLFVLPLARVDPWTELMFARLATWAIAGSGIALAVAWFVELDTGYGGAAAVCCSLVSVFAVIADPWTGKIRWFGFAILACAHALAGGLGIVARAVAGLAFGAALFSFLAVASERGSHWGNVLAFVLLASACALTARAAFARA